METKTRRVLHSLHEKFKVRVLSRKNQPGESASPVWVPSSCFEMLWPCDCRQKTLSLAPGCLSDAAGLIITAIPQGRPGKHRGVMCVTKATENTRKKYTWNKCPEPAPPLLSSLARVERENGFPSEPGWVKEAGEGLSQREQKLFINGIYFDKSFPRDVQISKLAANKDL